MDEAAPQAASGMSRHETEQSLAVLALLWEGEYLTGYDDERGWWASRIGVNGHIITAAGPVDLNEMMAEESGSWR